jgi:energy-coupling factor transporter ATP-binding protein EcfA2
MKKVINISWVRLHLCFGFFAKIKKMFKKHDFTLKNGSTMLIAGPTESGKSTFVRGLLRNLDLFEVPPRKIYWFYGQHNDSLVDLPSEYELNEGLPESFQGIVPYSLVVLDDLMHEAKHNVSLTALFTKTVHHNKLFVINITQNFYEQGTDARTRRLNAQYIVLFKNPADVTQVNTLARQMFPHDKGFLPTVYHEATKRPYGYLFIDLKQACPDSFRVRSNILPHEHPMVLYASKRSAFCS